MEPVLALDIEHCGPCKQIFAIGVVQADIDVEHERILWRHEPVRFVFDVKEPEDFDPETYSRFYRPRFAYGSSTGSELVAKLKDLGMIDRNVALAKLRVLIDHFYTEHPSGLGLTDNPSEDIGRIDAAFTAHPLKIPGIQYHRDQMSWRKTRSDEEKAILQEGGGKPAFIPDADRKLVGSKSYIQTFNDHMSDVHCQHTYTKPDVVPAFTPTWRSWVNPDDLLAGLAQSRADASTQAVINELCYNSSVDVKKFQLDEQRAHDPVHDAAFVVKKYALYLFIRDRQKRARRVTWIMCVAIAAAYILWVLLH
jgi:hypothetical protein